jgi:hypothetical protein
MECPEFSGLLSAYHDGELPADREAAVAAHVRQCPRCAAELKMFRALSQMATELDEYPPPREVWQSIETRLDTKHSDGVKPVAQQARRRSRRKMLAMTLLATFGVTSVIYVVLNTHHKHEVDLGPFIDLFEQSPKDAQMHLVARYSGQRVTLAQAVKELKYQPAAAKDIPPDYELSEANLLQMPCCRCLEVCWQRKRDGMLCIFEHERDQFVQFGQRDVSTTVCDGNPTRIVQMDGRLAATWKHNGRFITVVGAEDIAELSRLMRHFEQPEEALPL